MTTTTTLVTEAMKTALSNAFTGIQTDVTSIITTALPAALAIAGIGIAVRIGWSFFKSIAR